MSLSLSLKNWLGVQESNEDLMLKYAQTGESKYIALLIKRCGDDLYYYLVKQCNCELAKDVSQIAWVKVIDKRTTYTCSKSFKSWLFKIARSALVDEYRKQNRSTQLSEELVDEDSQSALAELSQVDTLARFNQILARLPFLQREAFILQQEGFSLREIASITEAEIETVKTRLRYAKQGLRALVDRQEIADE